VNVPVQEGAAFRVTGMAQDGGIAGRDVVHTRRVGIAPSFTVGNEQRNAINDQLFVSKTMGQTRLWHTLGGCRANHKCQPSGARAAR